MADADDLSEIPEDFDETYGYAFRDPSLIVLAMHDPSYFSADDPRRAIPHNRRLELVGDGVIRLAMREYLYRKYAYFAVGDIELCVAEWVSNRVLASVAQEIGLHEFMLVSKAFDEPSERQLACVLEAVLGALMIDAGYDATRAFVDRWVVPNLPPPFGTTDTDRLARPKATLHRLISKRGLGTASYQTTVGGPGGTYFEVAVSANGTQLGLGSGSTIREASNAAARDALSRLDDEP